MNWEQLVNVVSMPEIHVTFVSHIDWMIPSYSGVERQEKKEELVNIGCH